MLKYCECGCGQIINSHDKRGRERRFVWGHNTRGERHWKWKNGKNIGHERRNNNLKYHLNKRISRGIRHSIRKGMKNGRRWESLVDYNAEQLKKRLESTMPEGYTWQDFIDGKLHIDHKIPISAHNFDTCEHIDFKKCWSLSNLQLLPAKDNMKKNNKITETFQPSLAL